MPDDPLYSKMKVEHDFQIAIDQNDTSKFIELLESSEKASFTCAVLPPGQPHSCDNLNEIWGHPSSIFAKLNFEMGYTESQHGTIKKKEETITLRLTADQVQNLVVIVKEAASTPVFFEYEHYLLLEDENGEMRKLNVWGWCQNGHIEYAN